MGLVSGLLLAIVGVLSRLLMAAILKARAADANTKLCHTLERS